jgi:TolB-like protein/cytochrome c-type biogenesis protein CcmH/NrfG
MTERSRAVFLSYASQDAEAARRICEALRAGGIEVWFDQSELRGGDAWDRQIRQQIHDCALFIPIISATTQGREEGYFRREWKLGVDRTYERSDRRAFLVPVTIDDTGDAEADVPEAFRAFQWTRLPAGETPPAFLARISQLLSPSEPPSPAHGLPANRPRNPGAAESRRSKLVPVLIILVALLGIGYIALDKFALSKRTPTSATASLPGEPAATPINEKSIAVLPFADLSEKRDQEYFSDGLADELLDLLAKTPGLHVIARTSSFSFKGKSDDIPTIAQKLHVANILEGSVRKSGNRLRVTTQLIRASSGENLWSETYDRELKDVFAVQDEIAAAVVGQLKLKLTPAPTSAARRTSNIEAYNQDLLGREFSNRENLDGWKRAIVAYRRAIELDPNYLAPYDGLALAELYVADETGDAAGYQRAQDAATKAVELGPDDPNGYAARGFIRLNMTWDWTGAQADFEKAIALDPGDARFQQRYGTLLASLGRMPEAIAATRKAIQLDPLQVATWRNLIGYLLYTRDFAAAQEAIRRALEISPESTLELIALGTLQLLEGNAQDALATYRRSDVEAFRLWGIAMSEYTLKDPKASQQALDELIAKHATGAAYQIGTVYAWRGEKDKAFDWMERAYVQRDEGLANIKIDPVVFSLRGDPRYKALLRKMNLPE